MYKLEHPEASIKAPSYYVLGLHEDNKACVQLSKISSCVSAYYIDARPY